MLIGACCWRSRWRSRHRHRSLRPGTHCAGVLTEAPQVGMIEHRLACRIASGELFQGKQQLIGNAVAPIEHGQLIKLQQSSREREIRFEVAVHRRPPTGHHCPSTSSVDLVPVSRSTPHRSPKLSASMKPPGACAPGAARPRAQAHVHEHGSSGGSGVTDWLPERCHVVRRTGGAALRDGDDPGLRLRTPLAMGDGRNGEMLAQWSADRRR